MRRCDACGGSVGRGVLEGMRVGVPKWSEFLPRGLRPLESSNSGPHLTLNQGPWSGNG